MLKNQSQEKSIPEVMFSSGVCNSYNVANHNCRKVDLLPLSNKSMKHWSMASARLRPWPLGMTFFMMNQKSNWWIDVMSPFWRIGVFSALFADSIFGRVPATVGFQERIHPHGHTHQSQQLKHPISHPTVRTLGDNAISIKLCQIGYRNPNWVFVNKANQPWARSLSRNTARACSWQYATFIILPFTTLLWRN